MQDVKTIVLEDGIEYYLVDEMIINDVKYYFLANINDEKDFCVRKQLIENNEEYMTMLDSMEELNVAMTEFAKKYQS